ncbi:MAG: hypothetical protein ACK56I_04545, partial [bacterium]
MGHAPVVCRWRCAGSGCEASLVSTASRSSFPPGKAPAIVEQQDGPKSRPTHATDLKEFAGGGQDVGRVVVGRRVGPGLALDTLLKVAELQAIVENQAAPAHFR